MSETETDTICQILIMDPETETDIICQILLMDAHNFMLNDHVTLLSRGVCLLLCPTDVTD